jgi:hypothetical protein
MEGCDISVFFSILNVAPKVVINQKKRFNQTLSTRQMEKEKSRNPITCW